MALAIAPSILAADFSRLGELVRETERGGADRVHVDVMDGHFVPNLSMGPIVVKGLRPVTRLPLEVHLMVEKPDMFVEPFVRAGADSLIVHHEVLADAAPLLNRIRSLGARAGLAINPGTAVEVIERYLPDIDLVLCMTVWPGFGGQAFLPESPARIAAMRRMIDRLNSPCELEVDGGIDMVTAESAARSGATVFVAGTSLFGSTLGPRAATEKLAEVVRNGAVRG